MTSFSEDMVQRGMRPGSKTLSLDRHDSGRLPRPLPARLALRTDRRRQAAPARGRRDDGDRDAARARVARAGPHAHGSRGALVLRAARRPLRDRDRRRHPDDRADGDERGGVVGARRAAALARLPVRADDALRERRDRRVRALDLPRRPLPPRHRAEPSRPRRRGAGVRAPRRADERSPGCGARPRRAAPQRDPRAAGRARAAARALGRVRRRGGGRARPWTRTSCGWSGTGPPTTPPRTASTPSACCPRWTAMRDSISLSVYYGAEIDLRGSLHRRALAVGRDARRARLRRARAGTRRLHDRDHERSATRRSATRPRSSCRSRPARSARSRRRRPIRTRSRRSHSWPPTPPGRDS